MAPGQDEPHGLTFAKHVLLLLSNPTGGDYGSWLRSGHLNPYVSFISQLCECEGEHPEVLL